MRLSLLYAAGVLALVPAAPLAAQASRGGAIGVGFTATLGDDWQIEGGDVAYVYRRRSGLLAGLAGGIRLGAFVDQGAVIGGSRGFVFGGTLAARSAHLKFAEFGDERHVTAVGLDLTLELAGYLSSNSPLPHGNRWAAVSLLPGIRAGGVGGGDAAEDGMGADGIRYSLVIGPTLFFGRGARPQWRGMLALRIEAPLARRERHPSVSGRWPRRP
ncbi:MAG: hypothetical protein ACREX3_02980 [Gammaproteobacteria bacterium]